MRTKYLKPSNTQHLSSGVRCTRCPDPIIFHLSPRLCPPTAGCSPPLMPFIPRCLFAFLFQVVPSFFALSFCHFLLGRPLDLFPLLGCHSVQRLVYLLSFTLAVSSPFPLLFQCVFYNGHYLCSLLHTSTISILLLKSFRPRSVWLQDFSFSKSVAQERHCKAKRIPNSTDSDIHTR